MFWRKDERENLWQRDQVRFAEVAHNYPCCDVPTITMCMLCGKANEHCQNRAEARKAVHNWILAESTGKEE